MIARKMTQRLVLGLSILFLNSATFSNLNAAASMKNIVEVAQSDGRFTRLVKALTFTGLDKTLMSEGPFTVFAPTDEAFAKFDQENPGVLDNLMKTAEGTEKIKDILLYHVVSGAKVTSSDVKGMTENKAANGKMFKVSSSNGVKINDATVVKADIEASNGIIHVIDKVLMYHEDQ